MFDAVDWIEHLDRGASLLAIFKIPAWMAALVKSAALQNACRCKCEEMLR
ncbi:MAG: hypothetical protein ABJN34_08600 [Litoreibacter sp.]